MEVRKDDFPIVIQAYNMADGHEIFVAEQVVNSQAEVDMFTNRYAGKLIKAKQHATADNAAAQPRKKSTSAGTIILVVLLILVVVLVVGYFTGFFQLHP